MKAFPILVENPDKSFSCNQGMDLRDYFAAKAMQLFVAAGQYHIQSTAESAYKLADAMMEARNGK